MGMESTPRGADYSIRARARRLKESGAYSATILTHDQFDGAVELWNAYSPLKRREERAICLDHGHDRTISPWGEPMCRRCLDYFGGR